MRLLTMTALLLAIALPAAARTLEVGPGRAFAAPSDAAKAARNGDHITIAAGEYYDCAFWQADDLVIEGAGPKDTVITDATCGGKALFVISGARATVRQLTLARARVPDGNGAGIRAEGDGLTIEHVRFLDNQSGILGGPEGSTMIVRDSEFIGNGICEGACAHAIYAAHIALLHVEHSRFFATKQGHHIKSRAQRTEVIGCDIQDGKKGTASYLIEAPNGGSVVVRDTLLEKGPNADNHSSAISIGAEGVTQRTAEILVEHNVFHADGGYDTVLVNNLTATEAQLVGNQIFGRAKPLHGDGSVR